MSNFIEQLFALFDINVKQKKTIYYPETIYLEKNIEKYLKIREKIIIEISKLYTSGFISRQFYYYRPDYLIFNTASTIVISFDLFKFASKPYNFDKKYYLNLNYYPDSINSDIKNNPLFLSDLNYNSYLQGPKILLHQKTKSYINDENYKLEYWDLSKRKMAFIDKVFFILKEYKHYITESDLEETLLHILDNVSKTVEDVINPVIIPEIKAIETKASNSKTLKSSTSKRGSGKK